MGAARGDLAGCKRLSLAQRLENGAKEVAWLLYKFNKLGLQLFLLPIPLQIMQNS